MKEKDLYSVLGLARGATPDQVKKAYRKLARKCHPDLHPGDTAAEERFKDISEAHEVLSDTDKRKAYDEFGIAGVQAGFDAEQARAQRHRASRAHRFSGAREAGAGGGQFHTFEDLFGDLFSEGTAAGPSSQRGGDFEQEIEIDLLDAVRGLSTTVALQRPRACGQCSGRGFDTSSGSTCSTCGGKGRTQMARGPMTFTRMCETCAGAGRTGVRPCSGCGGAGHTTTSERLSIRIPAGVDSGSRVRVAGKGGPGSGGAGAGDLYIRIRVRPHPLLERKGDDLHLDLPITIEESVLGGSITVPTPGGSVRVRVPARSDSGRQLRVRGHGVPRLKGTGRGDLYLRLMIRAPDGTGDEVERSARALGAAYGRDPREDLKL